MGFDGFRTPVVHKSLDPVRLEKIKHQGNTGSLVNSNIFLALQKWNTSSQWLDHTCFDSTAPPVFKFEVWDADLLKDDYEGQAVWSAKGFEDAYLLDHSQLVISDFCSGNGKPIDVWLPLHASKVLQFLRLTLLMLFQEHAKETVTGEIHIQFTAQLLESLMKNANVK